MRLGSADYILKPIDYEELGGILGELVARLKRERATETIPADIIMRLAEGEKKRQDDVVYQVKRYILEHIQEDIYVEDIARKRDLPGVKILNFIVVFTMLFNGGLVPTYMIYTTVFHIKNTVWGLIVPNLLMNAFMIMLVRNYFEHSIPEELYESARIDGAGEFYIFFRIVIPLSVPILATVGLMTGISYWNDWQNGLYYLAKDKGDICTRYRIF